MTSKPRFRSQRRFPIGMRAALLRNLDAFAATPDTEYPNPPIYSVGTVIGHGGMMGDEVIVDFPNASLAIECDAGWLHPIA